MKIGRRSLKKTIILSISILIIGNRLVEIYTPVLLHIQQSLEIAFTLSMTTVMSLKLLIGNVEHMSLLGFISKTFYQSDTMNYICFYLML